MNRASESSLDRTRPPASGHAKPFLFPDFEIHRIDNGLNVYLARYPRGPLVHLELLLPGGAQNDPVDDAGLTSLTASVLDEGTFTRSSQDIARIVDGLGGYLSSQADWDAMAISFGSLSEHLEHGVELIADIATNASLSEHELERLRDQQLARIRRRMAQPSTQAADALAELLYPDTIYARPLVGTLESVQGVDRDKVVEVASRHARPDAGSLVLVGDIDPDACLATIESAFGRWSGDHRPAPVPIVPTALEGVRVKLVDRPDAPQTELWLGHAGVPRNHPDRAGLAVLNSLLGGKFTSRINLNLRERLGITYGASSSFSQRRGPGPFVVEASVDTQAVATAVTEIQREIRRLQDETVTESELDDTKSYLVGVFPYTLQRIEGLADRLGDLAVFDLPATYFSDLFARIRTVTAEDLLDLARRHLHPDRLAIAAAGPRTEIEDQLSRFGELEIGVRETVSAAPKTEH